MTENNHQVYQFRAFVQGISPVIWRRLLFRDDQTLADMHYALQIVFNWTDLYLHQFHIRGRTYTVPRICGADYTQPAQDVPLQSLHLRAKERFVYEYNFFDWWRVDIRFEKQLDFDETKSYPVCIGGKQAGPPEDCGGVHAYLALREEKYHPFHLLSRLREIVEEAEDDTDCGEWIRDEFPDLLRKQNKDI
ncbi:MAG: plasmid pRiA4b ORF-3 family protein [Gammaproteobacteria bacterium]|nr:plasmid pRiA4b ORF-3 family protein [Gammaproteobacteria bacterium]